MIRVALVDDDALVRAGLRLILGGADDIAVVAEAGDGAEALSVLRTTAVDVVLMDIRMPRMDGLSATAELQRLPAAPQVVVLTTFDADDYVLRALRHGASGFLLKDTPPDVLVDAVRKVAAGEPMLSPSVTEQLIRRVRDSGDGDGDARARLAVLSERELEVAVAVGRGMSNAEIATTLHMSIATVKAHVSRILTKLDASNRVQVAIAAHDAGLV
ncbi:response regulator transcription factor [Mumia zhuanghuii]|uniref:Response regulator n=2 Tax=Mumia TaxID=1546255 RepID=A0ABW1QTD8_9ACTN|nr:MULTISPECIES: response regulator transcription factor [Mumia]KAA1420560.1 response regulator transcription factor [Mumia zhuanghuii]